MFCSIISAEQLERLLTSQTPHDAAPVIVDCRFSLSDASAGKKAFMAGHIPGAAHADLERDLSGPAIPGRTGRHPLPDPQCLAERLGSWGISNTSQVVAYDDAAGAIAARLWWLLRWLGHQRVAVLDGGFGAWRRIGGREEPGEARPVPATFTALSRPELCVDADFVERIRTLDEYRLIDARVGERFRGEMEPIDAVAGHIPGALSLPYTELVRDGRLLPKDELSARFDAMLAGSSAERAVVYCGSGVTACHPLLAMAHVGLEGARLYAGSWSEWIADPSRPVTTHA